MNGASGVDFLGELLVEILPGNSRRFDEVKDTASQTLRHHLQLSARRAPVYLMEDFIFDTELGVLRHHSVVASEGREALGSCKDNGVERVEGPLGTNPPDGDADGVQKLRFLAALGEPPHDGVIAGPGGGLFWSERKRTRVVGVHVADDAMYVEAGALEVTHGDENVDVSKAICLQALEALFRVSDKGAEEGGLRDLGEGGECHVGRAMEFCLEEKIRGFLEISRRCDDDSALENCRVL